MPLPPLSIPNIPHAFEAPYGTPMGGVGSKANKSSTKKAASTPRVKGKDDMQRARLYDTINPDTMSQCDWVILCQ